VVRWLLMSAHADTLLVLFYVTSVMVPLCFLFCMLLQSLAVFYDGVIGIDYTCTFGRSSDAVPKHGLKTDLNLHEHQTCYRRKQLT
jgi:hypothetical protein